MTMDVRCPALKGSKALIVGVANRHSIAYGCAKAFHELGADLAITFINEKTKTYVEPRKGAGRTNLSCRSMSVHRGCWKPCSTRLRRSGAGSTSCCTRSRLRPRTTCGRAARLLR